MSYLKQCHCQTSSSNVKKYLFTPPTHQNCERCIMCSLYQRHYTLINSSNTKPVDGIL